MECSLPVAQHIKRGLHFECVPKLLFKIWNGSCFRLQKSALVFRFLPEAVFVGTGFDEGGHTS